MALAIEGNGANSTDMDAALRKDLKVLADFVEIYCTNKHKDAVKAPIQIKAHELEEIVGGPMFLCTECSKLLAHSFMKRSTCPHEPKPACKRCEEHCYHPDYRRAIQEVMRFSGKKLLLSGRLDYLFKLLF